MMTEKEKMLAGEWHHASDETLKADHLRARSLLYAFNGLPPEAEERGRELLKTLFGQVRANFHVTPPFHCDYGYNIRIGEDFYANTGCTILDQAPVVFGDHVLVGPYVSIFTVNHPENIADRNAGLERGRPIRIGNSVWIGGNSVILPGVTIGDGSIIGAGSVVTHDIPPGVVAVGNPCRILRPLKD